MINIKSDYEIELIRKSSKIAYQTMKFLEEKIKPGITTKYLDKLAEEFILKKGAKAAFKGYEGFPNAICTSVNNVVIHGIPSDYKLKEGDIISIDLGVLYKGYYSDTAVTYPVGNITEDLRYLLEHTRKALYKGIEKALPNNRVGDISSAIEDYAIEHNLSVIEELAGHGVGINLHEDPDILNYGIKDTGPKLKPNMVIAIEPMLNIGKRDIIFAKDDEWNIKTLDGKPSAHFEHTILITENGYEILTGE